MTNCKDCGKDISEDLNVNLCDDCRNRRIESMQDGKHVEVLKIEPDDVGMDEEEPEVSSTQFNPGLTWEELRR